MNFESSLTCMALASLAMACSGSTQIGESGAGDGGSSGSVSSGGMGGSSAGSMGNDATATSGNAVGSGGNASDGGTSASTGSGMGGSGGVVGSGGSAGNGGNGGNGGSVTGPCEGRPCGASCSTCDPSSANCMPVTGELFCNAAGECTASQPTCEPEQCETAMDCTQPGAPCEVCADGSLACPYVDCINGECVGSFPTCTATACMADSDCPQSLAPCQVCADGTAACPWARCENGSCKNGTDVCGDVDPCEGKQCGDTCSPCGDDANCDHVVMFCNEELECTPNQPACSALACESDEDCPLVDACPPCADGTTCAELQCVNGACQFQCPDDGVCVGEGDSCAGGASCCSGLTCCAGVPIPEGEEYCSASVCPDSDVNLKTDFGSVDPNAVLERLAALPISTWSYKAESSDVKHIGPMAQDFMAAFRVGGSDRAIAKVDADGVAFAAIQALHARLEALEAQNAKLERELSNRSDCRSGD